MKKILAITLPVLLIITAATVALTQTERRNERRIETRKALKNRMALAGRGYRLGVILDELSPKQQEQFKIDSGVLVKEVLPEGPAEEAGLKDGDVILRVDGQSVSDPEDVRRALRDMEESKQVKLEILRDGKKMSFDVTPEERPMSALLMRMGRTYIGVGIQDLDADLATYFKVDPKRGVLVTRVEKDSPAEEAGMKSGDIILSLNGKRVATADEFSESLRELKEGEQAKIAVLRHGKEQTISVEPKTRMMPDLHQLRELRELRELPEMRELRELPDISTDRLQREIGRMERELRKLREEDIAKLRKELSKELDELRKDIEKLKNSD